MKPGQPSTTASRVALWRAAHQILDEPRVLDDPLALDILDAATAAELRANPQIFDQQGRLSASMRAFIAGRSRFAEDELARAVVRGVRQYVVLGAGLDTFAYRNPHPELRVFEVDHPATQAWKRARLEQGGIAIPDSLTFAPTDFEGRPLGEALRQAGFRADLPAFFSWLGVTMYLTPEALAATWRFVAGRVPGSGIVFDYILAREHLGLLQRFVYDSLSARVAEAGEPWVSTFAPEALRRELEALGFGRVGDVDPDGLNARYFEGRKDGLRVGGLCHLLYAEVPAGSLQ